MTDLRDRLLKFIEVKFSNIGNISELSEDIVNQAYLKMKSSKRYKKENENFGYLSKTAYNLALDTFNRNLKENKQNIPYNEFEESIPDKTNEYKKIENGNVNLKDKLNSLKKVEKDILLLKYFEEKTFKEISEMTGIKLNTVLSHHRRALINLKHSFSMLEVRDNLLDDYDEYPQRVNDTDYFQIL